MLKLTISTIVLLVALSSAQRYDGQFWPCNPLKNATGACTPNPGQQANTYSIDFTKQTSVPDEWTISNYATVNFGPLGAEFTFNKRYDAPQLWTKNFILFGRVSVVARVANGTGMISSAVLVSDDFDEIDFEMSGNNFGHPEWSAGKGQNNYFGKGVTGNYDRGSYFDVSNPQGSFHTYTFDWTPTELKWLVDGNVVRTHLASDSDSSAHQYPQTPSKLQLGIWAGGDPSSNTGTRDWAGGYTDLNGGPYTMFVKSVTIENAMPAWAYNYTDQSGSWRSIALMKEPAVGPSIGLASSALTSSVKSSASSSAVSISKTSSMIAASSVAPLSSTSKLSSHLSTAAASASKSSASDLLAKSTTKPLTGDSFVFTKTVTPTKPATTQARSPSATSVKKAASFVAAPTPTSSTAAIVKKPTATITSTTTSNLPKKQPSATAANIKWVYSYTTTTKKCSTTATKPTAYKMRAAVTSTAAWAWNGWSNQWHGSRKRPEQRHHHTHGRA